MADDTLDRLFDAVTARHNPSGLLVVPDDVRCLDTSELARLESALRDWASRPVREDVRRSRSRMLAIFLLLRHTGARIGEVLTIRHDAVDTEHGAIRLGVPARAVPVASAVLEELVALLDGLEAQGVETRAFPCTDATPKSSAKSLERCNGEVLNAPDTLGAAGAVDAVGTQDMPDAAVTPDTVTALAATSPVSGPQSLAGIKGDAIPAPQADMMAAEANGGRGASPESTGGPLMVDPGHVRRKLYDCAEACGLGRELGSPSVLRRSRAVELLRSGLPLPAVQRFLGHGNADSTASYVDVPQDAMTRMVGRTIAREQRRSSARNAFYGTVTEVCAGDIQASVTIKTSGGLFVLSIITADSLESLELRPGAFAMAEVKAPWVMLYRGDACPRSSAGNVWRAHVHRIRSGAITSEVVAVLGDGTEVCAVLSTVALRELALAEHDSVWVVINALSVVLDMV